MKFKIFKHFRLDDLENQINNWLEINRSDMKNIISTQFIISRDEDRELYIYNILYE